MRDVVRHRNWILPSDSGMRPMSTSASAVTDYYSFSVGQIVGVQAPLSIRLALSGEVDRGTQVSVGRAAHSLCKVCISF
jgi:hypothetical protein